MTFFIGSSGTLLGPLCTNLVPTETLPWAHGYRVGYTPWIIWYTPRTLRLEDPILEIVMSKEFVLHFERNTSKFMRKRAFWEEMAIFANFKHMVQGLKVVKMAQNWMCSFFFMYIKRYRCALDFSSSSSNRTAFRLAITTYGL